MYLSRIHVKGKDNPVVNKQFKGVINIMIIENGKYTIYVLNNTITNKIYVGVTTRSLRERFHGGEGYRHQKNIYADILKYGWHSFESEIFASGLTEEEAFHMEKILISKLRELDPDMLYNRDAGGKHGDHCEKTKEIIREINVGRVVTEEAKNKIRKARASQVFSAEALAKRSAKMKGRKMSPEFCKRIGERSSKAVRCIENGKEYPSMKLAAEDLGLSVSGISQQIKGVYKHVKGYHFEFV